MLKTCDVIPLRASTAKRNYQVTDSVIPFQNLERLPARLVVVVVV